MPVAVTEAEAEALFAAMAALGGRVAFGHLAEGCESRSQVMIDEMQALGVVAARAWALATPGAALRVPNGRDPTRPHTQLNHTAPAVAVDGAPAGVRVIDPSLPGVAGPLTVEAWAAAFNLTAFERLPRPLSQIEMLQTFADLTMAGRRVNGFIVVVELGVAPIAGGEGTGFRLTADPPEGPSAYARGRMREYLARRG